MAVEQRIAAVRRFNRFYTRTIGVLGDRIQRTPYSLTEARLFFELAQVDEVETVRLRQSLGLDAGYLSRIFARFEADGLVHLGRSAVDNRRQVVGLTEAGRRVFATMDSHAVEDMQALLGRLSDVDQARLLAAMLTIENLWSPDASADVLDAGSRDFDGRSAVGQGQGAVVLRASRPGDLGWVVQRHGELYAAEYGYDDHFEALVSRVVADFVANRRDGRDAVWIAELDGVPAGSVFCVEKTETVAQLRLLLLEPWARGRGVGRMLVQECVRFARDAGYREMVLWTNAQLHAARELYRRAGFELVSHEEGHDFGGPQVFENWRLVLEDRGRDETE